MKISFGLFSLCYYTYKHHVTGGYVHVGKSRFLTPRGCAGTIRGQITILALARQTRYARRFHFFTRLLCLHPRPAQILIILGRLRIRGGQPGELRAIFSVAACDYQRNHRGCNSSRDSGSYQGSEQTGTHSALNYFQTGW